MLQLLGRSGSINVRKVQWTCDEIGIPYAREDWGSGFRSTQEPEFLALNPNALVPVIKDGEVVLWESNTICRYLAAKHGRVDLLPAQHAARAQVEQWMDWQAMELNPSWRYPFYALVRHVPGYDDAQQIAAGARAWSDKMAILEQQLRKTGAYAAGSDFTLADIVLGLSVHRWRMTPIQHGAFPAIAAYFERLLSRPAFVPHATDATP